MLEQYHISYFLSYLMMSVSTSAVLLGDFGNYLGLWLLVMGVLYGARAFQEHRKFLNQRKNHPGHDAKTLQEYLLRRGHHGLVLELKLRGFVERYGGPVLSGRLYYILKISYEEMYTLFGTTGFRDIDIDSCLSTGDISDKSYLIHIYAPVREKIC